MYSLDINFLKDRGIVPDAAAKSAPKAKKPASDMLPLLIGVLIGILAPAGVGIVWFVLQQETAKLAQQQATQQGEIARLEGQLKEVSQINETIARINGETKALAGAFNQIKPWSAMLQDLRDRTPPNVQINIVEQKEVATTTPAAAKAQPNQATEPPKPPKSVLQIAGQAVSFNDVNDLLLTLQRSPFFDKDQTKIVQAKLEEFKVRQPVDPKAASAQTQVKYEFPEVVNFQIETVLNDISTRELLRELERKGDVGTVTRIRNLQEKGAIQQ